MATRSFSPRVISAPALALGVLVGCSQDSPIPAAPAIAALFDFSAWSAALDIEAAPPGAHPDFNTLSVEGCPFISRDGKTFYMASNRPGGLGGLDIWVSTRARVGDPWGQPVNVGEPVNSSADSTGSEPVSVTSWR